MFGGILKSCLEESAGEEFNKKKQNTDKYIDNLLSSFEHFDGFTTLEIYNISSPHDIAKELLEKCIQEHFSDKYVFDAIFDYGL